MACSECLDLVGSFQVAKAGLSVPGNEGVVALLYCARTGLQLNFDVVVAGFSLCQVGLRESMCQFLGCWSSLSGLKLLLEMRL